MFSTFLFLDIYLKSFTIGSMARIVEFTPKASAITEGYAVKFTAPEQILIPSADVRDWTVVDLGDHPQTNNSRMWIVFNADWLGESLNAQFNSDGSDADPSYAHTISSYEAERSHDPANVRIIEGSETTFVLRRKTALGYSYGEPLDISDPEETDL